MVRRLTQWIVEEMVDTLSASPDTCLVLHPSLYPERGPVRVSREGKRWSLHRYLYYRVEGREPEMLLLVGGCQTEGCLNPYHRIEAKRGSARTRLKCPNGHAYTLRDVLPDGSRQCRLCRRARRKRINQRRRKADFRRGVCSRGHLIRGDNVYRIRTADGRILKRCRTCGIDRQREYRERKRDERTA